MNKKIITLFALTLIMLIPLLTACGSESSLLSADTTEAMLTEEPLAEPQATQHVPEESEVQYSTFTGNISEYPFYDTDNIHKIPSVNAEIEIISEETGKATVGYTDDNGSFELNNISYGEYKGSVKKGLSTLDFSLSVSEDRVAKDLEFTVEYDKDANKYVYPENTTVKDHDLDGDGIKDEILYIAPKYSVDGGPVFAKLFINGDDFSYLLNERLYSGSYFAIIDIDQRDNKLQLVLNDYGPSTDFSCNTYDYDGKSLKSIGMIEGIVENSEWALPVYICGDGNIISTRRLNNFQTWYAYERWSLVSGELISETPEFYYTTDGNGTDLITLMDMTLFTEPSIKSKIVNIPAGTKLHLTITDNKSWVRATSPDGSFYWIYEKPDSFGEIETNGTTVSVFDLFDGLCMVD